jgi:transcriptional regulator with XRE-family HTH domain
MAAAAKRVGGPLPPFYEELRTNLATNLRAARLAAKLTQKELGAAALVARDYVRRIEAEATNVSLETLCSIAAVLKMHPLDLLVGQAPKARRRRS